MTADIQQAYRALTRSYAEEWIQERDDPGLWAAIAIRYDVVLKRVLSDWEDNDFIVYKIPT
jgi:hypothetical protein